MQSLPYDPLSLAELESAIDIELELALDPKATKAQIVEALQRAIDLGGMRSRQLFAD